MSPERALGLLMYLLVFVVVVVVFVWVIGRLT
jgi:hypothetical protein